MYFVYFVKGIKLTENVSANPSLALIIASA